MDMDVLVFWKLRSHVCDLSLLLVISRAMHLALLQRAVVEIAA
jgi:hypothetical protein